ncbi:MAG: hypothetical protein AAB597_01825 [Patescibacteria group bacterium]
MIFRILLLLGALVFSAPSSARAQPSACSQWGTKVELMIIELQREAARIEVAQLAVAASSGEAKKKAQGDLDKLLDQPSLVVGAGKLMEEYKKSCK